MQKKKACEITAQIAKTLHEMQPNPNRKFYQISKKKSNRSPLRFEWIIKL